jgi:hypothetical protein
MKRDLSTRELALLFHTTVEEVRSARADEEAQESLTEKTTGAPKLSEDDFNAWYCKQRTGGTQYLLELHGRRICTYQGKCLSQVKKGKSNTCNYKGS